MMKDLICSLHVVDVSRFEDSSVEHGYHVPGFFCPIIPGITRLRIGVAIVHVAWQSTSFLRYRLIQRIDGIQ